MDRSDQPLELETVAPVAMVERRKHRRRPVVWRGKLEAPNTRGAACAILNLSLGGAKLSSAATVAIGDCVKLTIDRFGTLAARVVWHEDGHMGVQFLEEEATVAAMFGAALSL
jgi:hypothetical protein